MTPDELAYREAIMRRFNVIVSTMQHTPNAGDDLEGWRRRWTAIRGLVADLDAFAGDPALEP